MFILQSNKQLNHQPIQLEIFIVFYLKYSTYFVSGIKRKYDYKKIYRIGGLEKAFD